MGEVNLERLFKLRLTVARFGEMDLQGWWNTRGVLAGLGTTVFARGFPRTAPFAQARVVFSVARSRTRELWSPSACATLWNLPAAIEDAFDDEWHRWLDDAGAFSDTFAALAQPGTDLLEWLRSLDLASDDDLGRARELRRSVDGRAVLLPGARAVDDDAITLLAGGFFRGERSAPAIPYLRLEE